MITLTKDGIIATLEYYVFHKFDPDKWCKDDIDRLEKIVNCLKRECLKETPCP